jgi:hypothetical protein
MNRHNKRMVNSLVVESADDISNIKRKRRTVVAPGESPQAVDLNALVRTRPLLSTKRSGARPPG